MLDKADDNWVLEINGLDHHLRDRDSGDEFVVRVDRPLRLERGSLTALVGPSGCGKTTLLTILGLLRRPTYPERLDYFRIRTRGGEPNSAPQDLKEIWMKGRQNVVEGLRRRHIGFALQSGELLPALTARENIAMPLWLNGIQGDACRQRVAELLNAFQLRRPGPSGEKALAQARINNLSGGEYQRVTLARAIAHRPTLVYVDEPTAALNRELAWQALEQLRAVQSGLMSDGAIVMITHDEELANAFADTVVRMAPLSGRPGGEVKEITRLTSTPREHEVELGFDTEASIEPESNSF